MTDLLDYRIDHRFASRGYDRQSFWTHARPVALPPGDSNAPPRVMITTQKARVAGSDVFDDMATFTSDDLGHSWTGPTRLPGVARQPLTDQLDINVCDLTPLYHPTTGKVLATGQTVVYQHDNHIPDDRPRHVGYMVYDPKQDAWQKPRWLDLPEDEGFYNCGSGSGQCLQRPDGDLLVPVYRKVSRQSNYAATVLCCGFDGRTLTFKSHGNTLTHPQVRGLCEPSLTQCGERYYMTLRNDLAGYVAVSEDGLNFSEPIAWRFDDGSELGNYNTQQHWIVRGDTLFLVYTRRGLNNDHVFRHRAPLLMAQVDTRRMQVIRESERVIVPNRGARLGNFGICDVEKDETWVVVTEWMHTTPPNALDCTNCERYGADNTIWVARLLWQ